MESSAAHTPTAKNFVMGSAHPYPYLGLEPGARRVSASHDTTASDTGKPISVSGLMASPVTKWAPLWKFRPW